LDTEKLSDKQLITIKEIIKTFEESFTKKLFSNFIIPFQIVRKNKKYVLLVLTSDVTCKIVSEISEHSPYQDFEVIYCKQKILETLLKSVAPKKNEFLDLLDEAGAQFDENEDDLGGKKEVDEYAIDDEINKSLLVNLFEGSLLEGVRKSASDIHIIPSGRSEVKFFFRIDGKLQLWHHQQNTSPEAMAAVVKDRSNGVDRFEREIAQDGFAQRLIDSILIRFRISIVPITSSAFERKFESVVIRIIDDRNVITDLRKLGFQEQAEKDFMGDIGKSKGMVLVTGPTGSGKSTTLMAALYQVISPEINVLTVEDPVEYAIKGARQLKIGNKMGFDQAIRAILRHDPDVVLVGEIRDKKTAEIAVKLSNTGHLTLSTLHTNDAPSVISRLFKMGIEPYLIANVINIIVAQRLVRRLCPNCRVPITEEERGQALELGLTEEDLASGNIYSPGPGCNKCNNGYKGRVNICEALHFSPEVRKSILDSGVEINEDKIRAVAEGQGMLSLLESGIDRIRNGLSTVEEIIYATSVD
ncbi:MAG: GspE/PulE family protein, partial [Candidatus Cloacimonadota bacterium]|nr:GspE/PulE family protein [Candidatus Cloacimonadota bacterium]